MSGPERPLSSGDIRPSSSGFVVSLTGCSRLQPERWLEFELESPRKLQGQGKPGKPGQIYYSAGVGYGIVSAESLTT